MNKSLTNKIIAGSAIALVGIGAYLILRNPKKSLPTPPPSPDPGGSGSGGSGGSGTGGGSGTSNLDFDKMADDIFDYMDGYMTNVSGIKTELRKLRTKADWDALVRAYGTRTVDSGTGNIFVSDFEGDLAECLHDEMSDGEIASINDILSRLGVRI